MSVLLRLVPNPILRTTLIPDLAPRQVHAALIVVLTRGGSTARLVAKYRPNIPVLTVAVPVLTTDSLTWTCSGVLHVASHILRTCSVYHRAH